MRKGISDNSKLVYSTEHGRVCPECGKPEDRCSCVSKKGMAAATDGIVRLRREVKGRGGKTVIVITGLPLDEKGLGALAKKLKKKCGAGGSVKNGVIEIQGERRDTLMVELEKFGFKIKLAGG
ncbi:MAG: translation initiation factor Sui1 [bacterium]|nr:translation initiation factor Sui1 [bacterium]